MAAAEAIVATPRLLPRPRIAEPHGSSATAVGPRSHLRRHSYDVDVLRQCGLLRACGCSGHEWARCPSTACSMYAAGRGPAAHEPTADGPGSRVEHHNGKSQHSRAWTDWFVNCCDRKPAKLRSHTQQIPGSEAGHGDPFGLQLGSQALRLR